MSGGSIASLLKAIIYDLYDFVTCSYNIYLVAVFCVK